MKRYIHNNRIWLMLCTLLCIVSICVPIAAKQTVLEEDAFFSGRGTEADPFLIENYEDLLELRTQVEQGNTFYNCYFRQTVDIDFSGKGKWLPIGMVGSNAYFYGVYDGDGHKLHHFETAEMEYGGLFGSLGGTVLNLGIEGKINGNYSGAFAAFSDTTSANIVNCYSIVDCGKYQYTGGLAYTFNGNIIHCGIYLIHPNDTNFGGCCEGIGNLSYVCTNADLLVYQKIFQGDIQNCQVHCKTEEMGMFLNDSIKEVFSRNDVVDYYLWSEETDLSFQKKITWSYDNFELFFYYYIEGNILVIACLILLVLWIIFAFSFFMHSKNMLLNDMNWKMQLPVIPKSKKGIFSILLLSNYIIYWFPIFFMHGGHKLSNYFVHDIENSFMDFFNPIAKIPKLTYIKPYWSNYPPLANMMFAMIRNIIPKEYLQDGFSIRNCLMAQVIFIIFIIVSMLLLYQVMCKLMEQNIESKIVICLILLSGPFLFLYERGNNLILVVGLVLFFITYFESENNVLRHLALISLALATALKIYPILFIILLITKKNYKDMIYTINYVVLGILVPCFYYDGFLSFIQFVTNLISKNSQLTTYGLGYNFSFNTVQRLLYQIFTGEYLLYTNKWLYIIPIFLCLALLFLSNKKWKKTLAICMMIIWFPSESYTYVLCFLVIPLLLFLEEKKQSWDGIYIICFAGIFSLYGLRRISQLNIWDISFPISVGMVIIHALLWIIVIFAILEELSKKIHMSNLSRRNTK